MSATATLTSKGQTTIPKGIRDRLGMQPGDRMTFTLMPNGTMLVRVKRRTVAELAGILRRKDRAPVPIERMTR
ncbi:MAG: AbrB/MazE/SpoVT family DNA-binding domain-containing protein [Casimicrobiaceae bacterium]